MLFSAITDGRACRSPQNGRQKASDNRGKHQQRDGHFRPAHVRAMCFFRAWNFLGSCGLPTSIRVQIHDADAYAMLHFAFAQIVQVAAAMRDIASKSSATCLESKNVAGITAIHDSLCDVDASAGDIGLLVQVGDFANRSAVNAHSHCSSGCSSARD